MGGWLLPGGPEGGGYDALFGPGHVIGDVLQYTAAKFELTDNDAGTTYQSIPVVRCDAA